MRPNPFETSFSSKTNFPPWLSPLRDEKSRHSDQSETTMFMSPPPSHSSHSSLPPSSYRNFKFLGSSPISHLQTPYHLQQQEIQKKDVKERGNEEEEEDGDEEEEGMVGMFHFMVNDSELREDNNDNFSNLSTPIRSSTSTSHNNLSSSKSKKSKSYQSPSSSHLLLQSSPSPSSSYNYYKPPLHPSSSIKKKKKKKKRVYEHDDDVIMSSPHHNPSSHNQNPPSHNQITQEEEEVENRRLKKIVGVGSPGWNLRFCSCLVF